MATIEKVSFYSFTYVAIFSLLSSFSLLFFNGSSAQAKSDNQRMQRILQYCERDRTLSKKAKILWSAPSVSEQDYATGKHHAFADFNLRVSTKLFTHAYIFRPLTSLTQRTIHRQDFLNWKKFRKSAAQFAQERELTDWQKAIFAKCLSSKIIRYDEARSHNAMRFLFFPTSSSIGDQYGDCKIFSRINNDLARSIKLPVRLRMSSNHAFVSYKINDTWYDTEPQNDDATFWPAHQTDY